MTDQSVELTQIMPVSRVVQNIPVVPVTPDSIVTYMEPTEKTCRTPVLVYVLLALLIIGFVVMLWLYLYYRCPTPNVILNPLSGVSVNVTNASIITVNVAGNSSNAYSLPLKTNLIYGLASTKSNLTVAEVMKDSNKSSVMVTTITANQTLSLTPASTNGNNYVYVLAAVGTINSDIVSTNDSSILAYNQQTVWVGPGPTVGSNFSISTLNGTPLYLVGSTGSVSLQSSAKSTITCPSTSTLAPSQSAANYNMPNVYGAKPTASATVNNLLGLNSQPMPCSRPPGVVSPTVMYPSSLNPQMAGLGLSSSSTTNSYDGGEWTLTANNQLCINFSNCTGATGSCLAVNGSTLSLTPSSNNPPPWQYINNYWCTASSTTAQNQTCLTNNDGTLGTAVFNPVTSSSGQPNVLSRWVNQTTTS